MKLYQINHINSAVRSLMDSTGVVITARGAAVIITGRNRQLASRKEVEYNYFQQNDWITFCNGKYGIAIDTTQFHTARVEQQVYGLAMNKYLGEWHIADVPLSLVKPLIAEAEKYFGKFPKVWEDSLARVGILLPKVFGWLGHQRPILCKVSHWGQSNFQAYALWKCAPDTNVHNIYAHNILTEDDMSSVMELYSGIIAWGADGRPYVFYYGWRDDNELLSRREEEFIEMSVYTDISHIEDTGKYIRAVAPYEGDLPELVSPVHPGDFVTIEQWTGKDEIVPYDFVTIDGIKGTLWTNSVLAKTLSYLKSGDISKLMSPFYKKTSLNHHVVVEVTESEFEADARIRGNGIDAIFIR